MSTLDSKVVAWITSKLPDMEIFDLLTIEVEDEVLCFQRIPVGRANRFCGYCGGERGDDKPDACLGMIKDVMAACCGHGVTNKAYVRLSNGGDLRGTDALDFFSSHSTGVPG